MGLVYLARDPQIEREVALKTVRFDTVGHQQKMEEAKARFLKEARISGRLQHPHIVTVYDVGEDAGTLYLAMEFVSG
jgi:serine/threonine-protein kinase